MSRTVHELRGVRGAKRREYHARNEAKFDRFTAEDAEFFDGGFLSETYRPSASIASVDADALAALDAMVERYGLARVVKSLRELADSRTDAHSDSFEAIPSSDEWKTRADALESLLGVIK